MQTADVLCLSQLRWDPVHQRPHHLMTRFARTARVFFVEEPVFGAETSHLTVRPQDGVHVVVPHLTSALAATQGVPEQRGLLSRLLDHYRIEFPLLWCDRPAALPLLDGLPSCGLVYDCLDDPATLAATEHGCRDHERVLLGLADVVFTGGFALSEAKRALHDNVHTVPASVDVAHFRGGRATRQPADQQTIARPRIGFWGAIDRRLDLSLIEAIAVRRPSWQLVLIGPVAGIDPATLPQRPNIHYLGTKLYHELPAYLSGWDAAMLPFVTDDSLFIRPTRTLEYLAAGLPVVSTPVRDVMQPYGDHAVIEIAGTPESFIDALARALAPGGRLAVGRADALLAQTSWDRTFEAIRPHVDAIVRTPLSAGESAASGSGAFPVLPASAVKTAD